MHTTNKKNGNGSGRYQPKKVWNFIDRDFWWEEEPEIPGQDKIVDDETLKNELFGDEDPDQQGDQAN